MRAVPPLVLLLLAPFVGEYLLGTVAPRPASWAVPLLPLVLLYGGGALLIREVARRLGRGYPTMWVLAVAYGLFEEGIVLGTLFNRAYLGLGLLDHGWWPALGTSPVWTAYVVGIHSVWSILVPVVLTEQLFPATAGRPWLRVPGTVVTAVVFAAGATLVGLGNHHTHRFVPGPAQALTVLALVAACVGVALLVRPAPARAGCVPRPGTLAVVTVLCGSAFVLAQEIGPTHELVPPPVTLAVMLTAAAAAGATVLTGARRTGWSAEHTLGALGGALATYCWAGFLVQFSVHGFSVAGLIAQTVFAAAAVALYVLGRRRGIRDDGRTGREPAARRC